MRQDKRVFPVWMAYSLDNPLRRLSHNPEKLIGAYLQPGMKALDMGCGLGHFSLGMAGIVGSSGSVVAVDLQEGMLAEVRSRARQKELDGIISTHRCYRDRIGLVVVFSHAAVFRKK